MQDGLYVNRVVVVSGTNYAHPPRLRGPSPKFNLIRFQFSRNVT